MSAVEMVSIVYMTGVFLAYGIASADEANQAKRKKREPREGLAFLVGLGSWLTVGIFIGDAFSKEPDDCPKCKTPTKEKE
jgi:hypothetical protein